MEKNLGYQGYLKVKDRLKAEVIKEGGYRLLRATVLGFVGDELVESGTDAKKVHEKTKAEAKKRGKQESDIFITPLNDEIYEV